VARCRAFTFRYHRPRNVYVFRHTVVDHFNVNYHYPHCHADDNSNVWFLWLKNSFSYEISFAIAQPNQIQEPVGHFHKVIVAVADAYSDADTVIFKNKDPVNYSYTEAHGHPIEVGDIDANTDALALRHWHDFSNIHTVDDQNCE
jgi:hypothetical protein